MAVTLNAKGTSVSSFTIGKGGQAITLNANGYLTIDDGVDTEQPIGYNTIPIYEIDANDTFDLAHAGMMWHKDAGGAVTFTCDNDSTIPQGSTWIVHNDDAEDITIAQGTGVTIAFLASGAAPTTGDVTVSQGGVVTVYKYTDTEYWVWGDDGPFNILTAGSTTDSTLRWNGSAWAENTTVTITSTGVVTAASTAGNHTFSVDSATTNADIPVLKLSATSTGTPAAGIGPSIQFESETAAGAPGNLEIGGEIALEATDVTATTEDFDFVFNTMAAGAAAAERFRISSGGSSFTTDLSLTGTTHLVLPLTNDSVTPTFAFGDGDTGFYEGADDSLRVTIGASHKWTFEGAFFRSSNTGRCGFIDSTPSATVPNILPATSDPDTGIGTNAADQLSLIAGGVELIRATETGVATTDQVTIAPGATIRGAAATPSLAFGDGDTGLYESADDTLHVAVAGASQFNVTTTRLTTKNGGVLSFGVPSATVPVFIPSSADLGTGIGRAAAGQLSLIADSVEIMRLVEDTEDYILSNAPILIAQSANAVADVTDYGQIWVKNDAPTTLMFTDDTGVDQVVITSDSIVGDLKNCASGTATLSTTADDYVELFSVARVNGAHSFILHTTVSDSGFSVAKTYIVSAKFSGTGGTAVYEVLLPIQDSGVYSGNDYRVEIDVTTTTATVRAVRTSGASAGTLDWEIWSSDDAQALTITPLSGTGTSAVTAIYNPHRIADIKGTDYVDFTHDGTNFSITGTNTGAVFFTGMSKVYFTQGADVEIRDGAYLRISDTDDTDYVDFSHAGAGGDFNIVGTNTTDINMTSGITAVNLPEITLTTALDETYGGTGQTTYTQGDVLYASAANVLSKLPIGSAGTFLRSNASTVEWSGVSFANSATTGDIIYASSTNNYDNLAGVATGNALISGGVGTAPSWGKIALTTHVSGVLPEANGGTNQSTYTTGDLLYSDAANSLAKLALGNVGEVLTVVGSNVAWNPPAVIEFAYDSTVTAADPGAGTIRFDSITIGSIANAYIDDLDASGDNAEWILSNLADGDILTFRSITDSADYIIASVNGTPTDGTGYWTVPLTLIHTGTIFTNGDQMRVSVEWAGSNATTSGFVTASGTPVDGQVAVWTSASDIEGDSNLTWNGTSQYLSIGDGGRIARTGTNDLAFQNNSGTAWMTYTDADGGVLLVQDTMRMASGNILKFYGTADTPRINMYADNATSSLVISQETSFDKIAVSASTLELGALSQASSVAVSGNYAAIVAKQYSSVGGTSLMEKNEDGILFGIGNYAEVLYTYNNPTTAADPGGGFFRVNTASFGTATNLYFDDLDLSHQDQGWFWNMLNVGDIIMLHQTSNRSIWLHAEVTSITDNTGWWTVGINVIESSGTIFTNADQVGIIVQRATTFSSIFLNEKADALADVAGRGQLWVDNTTPNDLYFTDDTGQDVQITSNGSLAGASGTVTSVDITAGTLIDKTGGPITTSGSITIDVDLSEATEAVFAPGTDYVLFLDGGVTGTAAKEAWTDLATAIAGTGLTASAGVINRDTISLTADVSGVLPEANGGTNQSTYTTGDLLYSDAANSLAKLALGNVGEVLTVVGSNVAWNPPAVIEFAYDSTVTAADPGAGTIRFDSVTIGSIANAYIDDLDASGDNAEWILSNLADGDILTFRSITDPLDYIIASVNGSTTDGTGYWTVPLTLIHTGTIFTNGDQMRVSVEWAGSNASVTGFISGTVADNQVVTGTGASSVDSSANLTFDGSTLTLGGTGQLLLPQENDNTTPTLAFGDGDTGFYELNDDTLRLSIGTSALYQFDATHITGTGSASFYLRNTTVTDTNPSLGPRRDTNTGIGSAENDSMSLIAGGVEHMRFDGVTGGQDHIKAEVPFYMDERTAALNDYANYGQLWVRTETPNMLMFTDDAGNDFTANNVFEIAYAYSSAVTSTDPGAGTLNFNSVTIGSITTVYIDDLDDTGRDNSYMLSTLADGDLLEFRSASDPADYIVATVNGAPTDSTGFWTISLTLVNTGTIFTNGDQLRIIPTFLSQAPGGGTVTSVDITAGTLIDKTGGPITTSGSITIDVDLSEATEAVYAPATDYLLFLDGGVTGTAAKESGVDFAAALAGTGLTASGGVINRDTIALTTDTSGDYVATITGGTGIDSTGATTGEGIAHTLSVDLGEVTAVVFDPAVDFVPIIDGGATGTTQKDAWADIATAIAGTGITATSGVLSADNNGTVTSIGITAGTLIDVTGSPVTTSGNITVDVDLSEATEAVYAPATDYLLFLDGGVTGTAAKESGVDFAAALAGAGLTASSGTLTADVPSTITVADESADTTCFPLFVTAATGNLQPKTGTNITFNSATGHFTATSKSFLIKHPTKEGKKLQYGSLEGPEHGVYVRGRLTDSDTIELPDYWTALIDPNSITVNLTPIGAHQELYVSDISDNKVVVGGSTEHMDFFYTVYAERVDVDRIEIEFDDEDV